jgi:hypothetical protein
MDKPAVLITGLGRAAGRRDEAGNALVKELRAPGAEAEYVNADVNTLPV